MSRYQTLRQARQVKDRMELAQDHATARYNEAVKHFCKLVSKGAPEPAQEEARRAAVDSCEAMLDAVKSNRMAHDLLVVAEAAARPAETRRKPITRKPPPKDPA